MLFLHFLKFLLILILYKLENSYIFPLSQTVMHRIKLIIIFAALGQLAAKILVIFVGILHSFFGNFSLFSYVYINLP